MRPSLKFCANTVPAQSDSEVKQAVTSLVSAESSASTWGKTSQPATNTMPAQIATVMRCSHSTATATLKKPCLYACPIVTRAAL